MTNDSVSYHHDLVVVVSFWSEIPVAAVYRHKVNLSKLSEVIGAHTVSILFLLA
jgi:hypothetical protein